MNSTLRIVLIIGLIIYFAIVINLLKKNKLILKYSLLWLLMGIITVILVIFPQLLELFITVLGFADAINGLLAFAIVFIMFLLMALTSIASKQSEKIQNLVQENALLEKKIRDMEGKLDKIHFNK